MTVICQLYETGRLLSVSYMGQVIGVCQLHGAGWRLFVSYLRQNEAYLLVTCGRLAVMCQLYDAG